MRQDIIVALMAEAAGKEAVHLMNIEIMLENPVGVGEHANILQSIRDEVLELGKQRGLIETLRSLD